MLKLCINYANLRNKCATPMAKLFGIIALPLGKKRHKWEKLVELPQNEYFKIVHQKPFCGQSGKS